MRGTLNKHAALAIFALATAHALIYGGRAQNSERDGSPGVPRTWDDEEVASLEVPLANPRYSPVHVSSDYYYRMPVRPIYKSYPIYAPGKEPLGYMDWLKQQEPEIAFDPAKL